ncbi:polysaccharide biosynthesis/export family protein [Flavitalea sp. BT771]|uniref:polysaccharide biosynthesis/export family protein n=1 Tax=Flavitalea sp. BT771 TaxID=3063329 RepID=UPI0026E3818C|nr:polysaccharide biosynthesis/export family protein [Flavitalea sp. BT771]MDO6431483.1 polysaccharide biosynthesis/export family protein [Flavitalea sp. BT771]MDV6220391.1 polysaccharide biosynthesis/export family protein [Flavitalea sp. BT771]
MYSKLSMFLILSGLLFMVSCVNSRKAIYFNNIQDTTVNSSLTNTEPVIQTNDLLNISVTSLNPEATMVFNTPNITTPVSATSTGTTPAAGGYGASQLMGYLVNADGNIKFPVLGLVKAAGLTKRQLEALITDSLSQRKLLVDPIVTARFLNFRVTVLGEVARPTTLNIANERISILEAVGLAGDLTIYAKRDNVLLIRESGGQKIVKRLDLSSSEILTSPYYYLKTNDVVYVEPRKEKIASTSRTQQLLPIILSAASLVAVVVLHYVN